jgi:hypothetical protein
MAKGCSATRGSGVKTFLEQLNIRARSTSIEKENTIFCSKELEVKYNYVSAP